MLRLANCVQAPTVFAPINIKKKLLQYDPVTTAAIPPFEGAVLSDPAPSAPSAAASSAAASSTSFASSRSSTMAVAGSIFLPRRVVAAGLHVSSWQLLHTYAGLARLPLVCPSALQRSQASSRGCRAVPHHCAPRRHSVHCSRCMPVILLARSMPRPKSGAILRSTRPVLSPDDYNFVIPSLN